MTENDVSWIFWSIMGFIGFWILMGLLEWYLTIKGKNHDEWLY